MTWNTFGLEFFKSNDIFEIREKLYVATSKQLIK